MISDDWLNLNAKFNTPFCSRFCPLSKTRRWFSKFCLCETLQLLPVTSTHWQRKG